MRDKAILFLLATAIISDIFFVVVVSLLIFLLFRFYRLVTRLCDNEFFVFAMQSRNLSTVKKLILWRSLMAVER